MNKTELVAAIAEQAEISKKDAEKALKAFTDVVAEELKKGEILLTKSEDDRAAADAAAFCYSINNFVLIR